MPMSNNIDFVLFLTLFCYQTIVYASPYPSLRLYHKSLANRQLQINRVYLRAINKILNLKILSLDLNMDKFVIYIPLYVSYKYSLSGLSATHCLLLGVEFLNLLQSTMLLLPGKHLDFVIIDFVLFYFSFFLSLLLSFFLSFFLSSLKDCFWRAYLDHNFFLLYRIIFMNNFGSKY